MKKTALTALAAVALAGSIASSASANEHHHVRVHRTAPVVGETYRDPYADRYRDSYASSQPDADYWAARVEGGAISAPAGQ